MFPVEKDDAMEAGMKKNKLGVTYNVFCGEELLRFSILSIRKQVDYINIVWQEYSWTGEKADDNLESLLNGLLEEGLIDKIIRFEFDVCRTDNNYSKLQCKKKNMGVRDLKRVGCTHGMLMDVDEFYRESEFAKAKQFIYKNKITHSVCSIYDYRILPIYRMREVRDYCVSFIFKLTIFSMVVARVRINNMPCHIDPHRTFPFIPILHKFYYLNMVSMHHMTGVRKDYDFKLKNSLSNYSENGRRAIKQYGELQNKMENMTEKEILKSGYIRVEDEFGILQEWKS